MSQDAGRWRWTACSDVEGRILAITAVVAEGVPTCRAKEYWERGPAVMPLYVRTRENLPKAVLAAFVLVLEIHSTDI
jgi:hypothetical protein